MREAQAETTGLATEHPEAVHRAERAFRSLQSGKMLALEEGDAVFEQACRQCLELGGADELAARLRAVRAGIAALRLNHRRAAELYLQAASTPGLSVALQWRYQFERALVLEDRGRDFMDQTALEEAVAVYETRVLALTSREERPQEWATTHHHLGNTLGTFGQRQRGTWLLERAIDSFETALSERSRERDPLDWAATQNSRGNALGILAQRHGDTDMLERSVDAFEAALEVRTKEATPQDWAITQNNLAAAVLALGQRKKDKTILKRAADGYKNVLQVWSRERAPMDWAATMNNLGTALRVLGEHRKGPRTLEQSVAAYRSALSERTRGCAPQDWAMTQNNLGAALHKLGVREEAPQHLEAAVDAYEQALKEWTRERDGLTWAMTRANLAAARKALAELSGDVELVQAALADLQAAAGVFRDASHAQYYELVTEQIALLYKLERRIRLAQEAEQGAAGLSTAG
ncbi:MAG: tetratricopeptide repeat protein [Gammaproteobacteria bacterium]